MIDEKDEAILRELKEDGRQSTALLSRRTKIPRVTVHDRIEKMKKKGVIRRFTVKIGYEKLGFPILSFVFVSYAPGQGITQKELAKKLSAIPGVHEVCIIAGEWDILLKVRGKSMKEVGKLIVDRLREFGGVGRTVSMPVYEMVKEE